LSYDYKDLAPYISEEQLKVRYQKHHQAYVNGANAILEKLDKARKELTQIKADIAAAKNVARAHQFTWGDYDTITGAVKNILTVLIAERDLHARQVKELKKRLKKGKGYPTA
jgi:superoxide dismutase